MWVAAARTIPTAAALVALVSMVLGAWGIVPSAPALAGTVLGLLVLLLFLGLRPLFAPMRHLAAASSVRPWAPCGWWRATPPSTCACSREGR